MFKTVPPSNVPAVVNAVGESVTDSPLIAANSVANSSETRNEDTPREPEDTAITTELLKEKKLEDIKNQCSELISELDSDEDPEAVVKKHISQLKKYNELKDIALGLVTMIADQRQLRTTDILEEMKVELSDETS